MTNAFLLLLSENHPPSLFRDRRKTRSSPLPSPRTDTVLGAGGVDDVFENFKRFWGDAFGDHNKSSSNNQDQSSNAKEDVAAGTTLIASIPVQSIKPGGLRLFLMFYLMGMQNTPDRGTWQAHQPTSSDDYVLEMYYRKDASAMLSIELREEEVRLSRCGTVPSTPYLMQETVLIEGILDELHQCAFDESVPSADRLLVPNPSNAIELAKGSLSFG